MGLLSAPLLAASATATLFGIYGQVSVPAAIAAVPIALWEPSLGIWLVAKGFRPQAMARRGWNTKELWDSQPDVAAG